MTCYVEDAAENGALYPDRGKLVNLYKIDTTDTGTYKAVRDTVVHSAPRNTVNGYSTSSYDLNKNEKIEDVWGSYTESGKKWLRFGQSQWVAAEDMEKTSSSSYIWSLIENWLNQLIYIIDGQPVYASEHVGDPVEIEGTQHRWVKQPHNIMTNIISSDIGEQYTNLGNYPFTVSVVEVDGLLGLSIDSYHGEEDSIEVPDSIEGLPVVRITNDAFNNDQNLKSITIPGSVREIRYRAFYDCENLESVVLSEGLITIEHSAFAYCGKLKPFVVPRSVSTIDYQAFYAGLSTIYGYAGTRAESYAAEESIRFIPIDGSTLPSFDFVIPSSTTAIAEEAFSGIPAKSVKLGSQVSSIGKLAFAECSSLEVIYIPSSVDSIAGDAFSGVKGLVIFGQSDSRAESFAREKGYVFIAVG